MTVFPTSKYNHKQKNVQRRKFNERLNRIKRTPIQALIENIEMWRQEAVFSTERSRKGLEQIANHPMGLSQGVPMIWEKLDEFVSDFLQVTHVWLEDALNKLSGEGGNEVIMFKVLFSVKLFNYI